MLSWDSSLGEIEQALRKRNAEEVGKEIGIGINKLRRILNSAGFIYDSQGRRWIYKGAEGSGDVRPISLWKYTYGEQGSAEQPGRPTVKIGNTKITGDNKSNMNITVDDQKGNTGITADNKGNTDITSFTPEEVEALKGMARERLQGKAEKPILTIQEAIQGLDVKTTIKKTFVISEDIAGRLDAFCKAKRIHKSDALGIAIMELLEKYED